MMLETSLDHSPRSTACFGFSVCTCRTLWPLPRIDFQDRWVCCSGDTADHTDAHSWVDSCYIFEYKRDTPLDGTPWHKYADCKEEISCRNDHRKHHFESRERLWLSRVHRSTVDWQTRYMGGTLGMSQAHHFHPLMCTDEWEDVSTDERENMVQYKSVVWWNMPVEGRVLVCRFLVDEKTFLY